MPVKKVQKAITNQRTPEEIAEITKDIDAEVPENLGEIMEDVEQKEIEENHEEEEVVPPVEKEESLDVEHVDGESADIDGDEKEEEEVETPEPAKPLPSDKERLKESGQEAMVLHNKNKKILEVLEASENLPEPTIDELKEYSKQMGSEYEDLDLFAQNMLKESLKNKRKSEKVSALLQDEKNMTSWINKVEEFVEDDNTTNQYPSLAGREEEFKKYCTKKTHVNADLELLVAGFLFKLPAPEPAKKNLMLPRGGGSRNTPPKPMEMDQDDAKNYRLTDQKKYKEMIKGRKFKIIV